MNSPTITRVKNFTKSALAAALIFFSSTGANAEWKIDLSRRQKAVREEDMKRSPASVSAESVVVSEEKGFIENLFTSGEPEQEIVILNTEKGFVPSTVRVRKGGKYLVHVVNVNEKEKNVSFVLDAFSEHHATYYGKVQSFRIEPKREGIYSFQSPETSLEGRMIVINPQGSGAPELRMPASAEVK